MKDKKWLRIWKNSTKTWKTNMKKWKMNWRNQSPQQLPSNDLSTMPYIIDNKLWIFISKNTSSLIGTFEEILFRAPASNPMKGAIPKSQNTTIHQADKIVTFQLLSFRDHHWRVQVTLEWQLNPSGNIFTMRGDDQGSK